MATDNFQQMGDALEKAFFNPARNYLAALTDHAEAITGIQIEAAKAYTEITFKEARGALDIRDAEGFKAYVSNQPELAREFSERIKNDAERVTQANQTFMENAQQVTQESVSKVQKAAEEGVQRVQKAAAAK